MPGYFGPYVVPDTLATPTDLTNWTGQAAPVNAVQLLRSATSLVLDATQGAYYDVDDATGLATDPQILAAMRDATCIQAAAWAAIKYDPLTGGVITATVRKSKSIGTAHFDVAGADVAAQSQADAVGSLVPDAVRKLQENNLLTTTPWDFG